MKLILFLIFCLINISVSGQKLSDKLDYKVTYKLTYKLDSTALDEPRSEYMILFTGDELSKFSSRAKTLENPIVRRGNSGHTSRAAITKFHYEILKENQTGKLYYTVKIPKMDDRFYYIEDIDQFKWEIQPETKKIKDYEVHKATTSFAGRDYVAWFTPEIPLSDGPYKFSGLPGLILEIADTEKHYVFEFFGLEKLSPQVSYKVNLNQYARTEKEKLLELWYRYRKDPMGYANNPNVKPDPVVERQYVEAFTKMLEKENNPIETKKLD